MAYRPPEKVLVKLLSDLCVVYGFCLRHADNERLLRNPPLDPDRFADAVFSAEGMDPLRYPDLRKKVKMRVVEAFTEPPEPIA